MQPELVRTRTAARPARRVEFTPAARSVIAAVCWRDGPQVVLLSWPAGAAYLPASCYLPGEFDVVLGHVEGCPIYADARRLVLFSTRRVTLDADASSVSHPHPPLHARALLSWEPGHDLTADGSAAPTSGLVENLVRELATQFGRVCPEAIIATYVRRAIDDLRGSVSLESLPEMAARLARHRLLSIVRPTVGERGAPALRPAAVGVATR